MPTRGSLIGKLAGVDNNSGVWNISQAYRRVTQGLWPSAPPGGVSAGLQLWLDASDASDASTLYDATSGGSLVAADGGVARWEDKSGHARHATQITSANRPVRKTAIQGGKDVLRFDGSNHSLSIPSSTATFKFLHSADATVFAVFKSGTTANPGHGRYTLFSTTTDGGSGNVGYELITRDSNATTENDWLEVTIVKGLSGNYPVYSPNNNFFGSGVFGVLSAITRPGQAASADRVSLRRNGGAASTANSPLGANQTPSTANASQDLAIGRRGGGVADLNGDIAEIIIYDSALSDANREAVENYLMAKWGIT